MNLAARPAFQGLGFPRLALADLCPAIAHRLFAWLAPSPPSPPEPSEAPEPSEQPSPPETLPAKSRRLVTCEGGEGG